MNETQDFLQRLYSPSSEDQNVDVVDYKAEIVTGLSTACKAACRNVEQAQQK